MSWRIISTTDDQEWNNILMQFPTTDVYFTLNYHRAYELNGDGRAHAFIYENQDQVLFYPFIVRPINMPWLDPAITGWSDIETIYGYSGPLCTTTDSLFITAAWSKFAIWCQKQKIVAEFIRFNPLIKNQAFVNNTCQVSLDRETVVVFLDCSADELWTSYTKGHRNKIRKAQSKGLIIRDLPLSIGLNAFKNIYQKTMERLGATQYYFFSDAYFDYLCSTLSDQVKIFAVLEQDQIVAAALFLCHKTILHYHLGGSDEFSLKAFPNNLLFHSAADWGRLNGYNYLHLGGGRTPNPNDSLLQFKASMSNLRRHFYIGKRIHNQEIYENLCAQWMQKTDTLKRPNYFLLYRLESTNL